MADIIFRCPHCPQHLRVPETEAAKRTECPHCHTESVVPTPAEQIECAKCHTVIRISVFDLRETFQCPGCQSPLQFSAAPVPAPKRRWSLFGKRGWRIADCLTGEIHPIEQFPFEIGSDDTSHLQARGAHTRHCSFDEDGRALVLTKRDPLARVLADGTEIATSARFEPGREHTLRIGPHYYILHGGRRLDDWQSQVDASQWFICDTQRNSMEGPYSRRELAVVLDQHPRDPAHTLIRPLGFHAGFPLNQFGEARETFRFQPRHIPSLTELETLFSTILPERQSTLLGPPLLRLQEITLEITQGAAPQSLLHEISLDFPGGHLAAVVGASGCGKSTLLKTIAGIMEPTAGIVSWRG